MKLVRPVPAAVGDAVRARLGDAARVDVVGDFPYATTHHTTELEVSGAGRRVRLLLKDLRPSARLPAAVGARPAFVDDPGREVTVYRSTVPELGLTPTCWAASSDGEPTWVLLEKVDGAVLWQLDDGPAWDEAARTLARLHGAHAERDLDTTDRGRLLAHDGAYYRQWAERALAASSDRRTRSAVASLARRAVAAIDRLTSLPRTLIHGEAYPSNILVEPGGRVLLVDWEMASLGPGVADLAALATGWEQPTVERLARAYQGALAVDPFPSTPDLLAAVDAARLLQCIQWLGWSHGWEPPPEHRQDWLAQGLALADRVGP